MKSAAGGDVSPVFHGRAGPTVREGAGTRPAEANRNFEYLSGAVRAAPDGAGAEVLLTMKKTGARGRRQRGAYCIFPFVF